MRWGRCRPPGPVLVLRAPRGPSSVTGPSYVLLLRSATLPCASELTGAEDAAGAEDVGQALWPRGHASALLGPRPPRPRCRECLRHLRVSPSAPVGTGLLTCPSVSCDSTGTGNGGVGQGHVAGVLTQALDTRHAFRMEGPKFLILFYTSQVLALFSVSLFWGFLI